MKFTGVGVFRYFYDNPKQISKFEERVVITTATSKYKAEKQILAEFKEYSTDGIEFTGEYTVTEILEDNLVTEVSHTMRVFDGTTEEYLDQFWYDLQPVSCSDNGWEHVWYNKGKGFSACYNCQKVEKGELWKTA